MKTIGAYVHTADKGTEKGFLQLYSCKLEGAECPVLKRGQCIHIGLFSVCVYGVGNREYTSTRRSRSYHAQIGALKKRVESLPKMPEWEHDTGIVAIGDYYYIPYAHASMCESVRFVRHGGFMSSDVPFVKMSEFGAEQVVTLFKFRPYAIMGGEITDWQKKSVPVFLYHLKVRFPELYEAAAALCPEIRERTLNVETITSLCCNLDVIPVRRTDGIKIKGLYGWLDVVAHEEQSVTVRGSPRDLGVGLVFKTASEEARLTFCPDRANTRVLVTAPDLIQSLVLDDPSLVVKEGQ